MLRFVGHYLSNIFIWPSASIRDLQVLLYVRRGEFKDCWCSFHELTSAQQWTPTKWVSHQYQLNKSCLDGSLHISLRDVLVLFLSNGQLIVCRVVQALQKWYIATHLLTYCWRPFWLHHLNRPTAAQPISFDPWIHKCSASALNCSHWGLFWVAAQETILCRGI